MKSPDIVIVGGGVAGSAAAITLAQAGRSVVLIEKESRPQHKVCGEFLSREALVYLRSLGFEVSAFGALPISAVRLAGRLGVSEAPLPFTAMSLTRRRLDEELLQFAETSGVTVLRGRRVLSLDRDNAGWRVLLDDETTLAAEAAFLATGKHDLRERPRPAGKQGDLIAFKMYWRLAPAQAALLEGHVELNLYRSGYAGLQPVEEGAANLCCLIRREEYLRIGARWEKLLIAMQEDCPHLRQRLQGAEPLLAKPVAVAAIPYGFVREHSDGVWALGDQAAVIPSFTGDGMSIALHSGQLAAAMYLRGETAESFQPRLQGELSRQVSLATALSQAMVSQRRRMLVEAAVRLWPGVLRQVAVRTRIRPGVMLNCS
ncbi:NAD(P)/FAD-dependent oxidoreductase [Granulicella mallensis]|uniref:FAD-dependent pyridine nucleotide-disulfide oxidoreductase n=1 Tax=Granulicella mallensis (strain ATCC BAA-1857 / DSM 23137 / MP5ACTX8) TaxID=682795 RepID=G8NYV6_GRAMM|nr:FAD-dependent oxidoreductase [Granulicella mallensis]AEU34519.1 FAD-dependent pyridine nucleotide-disulfide oxidoreductase [Granulicella mallensis MP5ACTX8]